jgi:cyclopropane fatty-acyl-phospholipid synthase-like methyltransferase
MTDFEALYQNNPDPWSVRSSWYERRKRATLLAALPLEKFDKALELGCGNGNTTQALAGRCGITHAVDLSPTALAECRDALARHNIANVHLHALQLPLAWPLDDQSNVDLIVVSELAYYFSDDELRTFIRRCEESLTRGGHWLMCHYTADFHDRQQRTQHIHDAVDQLSTLHKVVAHTDKDFRLDVWRKHEGI